MQSSLWSFGHISTAPVFRGRKKWTFSYRKTVKVVFSIGLLYILHTVDSFSVYRNVQREPTLANSPWEICSLFLCSGSWSIISSCRYGITVFSYLFLHCCCHKGCVCDLGVQLSSLRLMPWMLANQLWLYFLSKSVKHSGGRLRLA